MEFSFGNFKFFVWQQQQNQVLKNLTISILVFENLDFLVHTEQKNQVSKNFICGLFRKKSHL